jgi:hypothetical protein
LEERRKKKIGESLFSILKEDKSVGGKLRAREELSNTSLVGNRKQKMKNKKKEE